MFLINITFALCIIGTIFLAIGINIKNKIVRNIGIAIFSIVIIFWIWFFSWFFIDEDEELKSKMGEETTNNVSESTRGEDITSQVISNDSSIYKYGIIRKIKDDKITFINKENNIYILENKEQIKYINGRTSEQCKFSDLKEGYYINTSYDRTCYIYKNITGNTVTYKMKNMKKKENENMKKKILALALAGVLVVGALTGCGSSKSESSEKKTDDKKITVAASATPHAEILEEAKTLLKDKGYELEVKVFDDYVQPNNVVESGEFDANYFQHVPYLEQFNEEKGTHLVVAGKIHYEPFGIYPGTKKDLKDIAKGDKIAVPNDTTNEARALLLLQDNGIIKLKDGAGIKATVNDIEENPNNIEIVELEAAQVPRVVNEVAYVVLNGNYALEANYTVKKDALAYEKSDSEAAKTYVNVIAVKEGNENSKKIKALVDVLKSDSIKKFINEKYDGAVIVYDGE